MHKTMQFIHQGMIKKGTIPDINGVTSYFKQDIEASGLSELEVSKQSNRGIRALEQLYSHSSDMFRKTGQLSELDLSAESIFIGEARVIGKIDVVDTEKGVIIDYKTGKPAKAWPKPTVATYEALKLHKYRQQLLFISLY